MDQFPEEINRVSCMKILEKNQQHLILETRTDFTKKIKDALGDSQKSVKLVFDKRLWSEGRTHIVKELLELYGEVRVITTNMKTVTTGIATKPEDIPKDTQAVLVEFFN